MGITLFFSAYILFAFYFYNKDKQFWRNAIRYIKEMIPVSEKMLVFLMFIVLLVFPLLIVYDKNFFVLRKLGIMKSKENESSEEGEYFMKKYYPELEQDLDGVSIVLEQEDSNPFIDKIMYLFESGFSERERFKIEKAIERLTEEEEEKLSFSVSYSGKRVPLVVQIELDEDDREAYEFTFYSKTLLAEAIDNNIDDFCA